MAPPLIQLKGNAATFGGPSIVRRVELSVSAAERCVLIGRNGSGKSTLVEDRGRPGRTRYWQPLRAAGAPWAAKVGCRAEPDFAGFATTLPCRGRPRPRRRPLSGVSGTFRKQLGLRGDKTPRCGCRGRSRRARWRVCWRPRPIFSSGRADHLYESPTIEWLELELDSAAQLPFVTTSATDAAVLPVTCHAPPPGSIAAISSDRPRLCGVRGLARRCSRG